MCWGSLRHGREIAFPWFIQKRIQYARIGMDSCLRTSSLGNDDLGSTHLCINAKQSLLSLQESNSHTPGSSPYILKDLNILLTNAAMAQRQSASPLNDLANTSIVARGLLRVESRHAHLANTREGTWECKPSVGGHAGSRVSGLHELSWHGRPLVGSEEAVGSSPTRCN